MNLSGMDLNTLKQLLASGQITQADLQGANLSGSFGGPQPQQQQPQNALQTLVNPPQGAPSGFGVQDNQRMAGLANPRLGDLDHELVETPDHQLSPEELAMRDALWAGAGDQDANARIEDLIRQRLTPPRDSLRSLEQAYPALANQQSPDAPPRESLRALEQEIPGLAQQSSVPPEQPSTNDLRRAGAQFVRNESTGQTIYMGPNGQASDRPTYGSQIQSAQGQAAPSMMQVIGTSGGSRVQLSPEQAPAKVNLDYSQNPLQLFGGAKAIYSKDEPGVAYVMGPDGRPTTKVLLGYDMQGSMQLNKANADMAHLQAETAHTQEQTRASQVNNPDMGAMGGVSAGLSGDELLKNLDPGTAGLVKAYADGRLAFPGGAAMRSPRMMQLLSLVSAYDPSFDAKDFNTRNKAQIAFTSGRQADAVRAADQAITHAAALSDDIGSLNNFNGLATPLNSVVNPIESAFGDPRQGRFKQNALALSSELRKVFAGGGGGGLSELQSWESGLPLNASQDQQRQYLAKGMDLLQGAIGALNDQYQRAAGPRADIKNLFSPTAQAALQKLQMGDAQPSVMGQQAASPAQATGNGPIRVASQADYDALPSGSVYQDPNGHTRRKR